MTAATGPGIGLADHHLATVRPSSSSSSPTAWLSQFLASIDVATASTRTSRAAGQSM
jgi:hypothetical protein